VDNNERNIDMMMVMLVLLYRLSIWCLVDPHLSNANEHVVLSPPHLRVTWCEGSSLKMLTRVVVKFMHILHVEWGYGEGGLS
jgi:hypothetical protein